jgi:Flp pilus assembly protein TadG
MQRLTHRGDDGLATIFFVLLMVVMVGAMALAIDGGVIFSNKQSDQNGADAAAMAIALSCANGQTCSASVGTPYINPGGSSPSRTGQTLSSSIGSSSVTATVSKVVDTTFGSAIGVTSGTTSRSATAKWQQLKTGTIFAFTFSTCAFPSSVGIGSSNPIMLYANGVPGCSGQGANAKGFVSGGCQVVSIGNTYSDANGNSFIGTNCSRGGSLDNYVGTDVLLPVWSSASGTTYTLGAMVEFHLLGWSGNGNSRGGAMTDRCQAGSFTGTVIGDSNSPCAYGYVVRYGVVSGGTTGASCTDSLPNACFVFLES